jgi:hypothetical protein
MSKCCQVNESFRESLEDSVSVASTSVSDLDKEISSSGEPELAGAEAGMSIDNIKLELHIDLSRLARQELAKCEDQQRPRTRAALTAFLRRALRIQSGWKPAWILDPLEVLQMLISRNVLPSTSAKADAASFGNVNAVDKQVCRGIAWLLDSLTNKKPDNESMSTAKAMDERRRLRMDAHVVDQSEDQSCVLPLAYCGEAEGRIVRQIQDLPHHLSERALARWIVSHSFVKIPINVKAVVQEMFDDGVANEEETGRLNYRFMPAGDAGFFCEGAGRGSSPEVSEICSAGWSSQWLLKRVRRKWTIDVVPTYRSDQISSLQNPLATQSTLRQDDSMLLAAARLRGRLTKQALRACHLAHCRQNRRYSYKEDMDDELLARKHALREDARARCELKRTRRSQRAAKEARDSAW